MDAQRLVENYLTALEDADLNAMLGLFAPEAMVHSPLYGPTRAVDFYPRLFADTSDAQLTLKGVMRGSARGGRAQIAAWFHFDWRLPSGRAAPFDVVDVMEVDDELIAALHIVYDTVDVRPAFEADTGSHSWRHEAGLDGSAWPNTQSS
jgi:ketosteroid isomerase-like protein